MKTKFHSNALAAKVAAVNSANAEAQRLFPILSAIFAPLVGCKVEKVDGSLLASVAKLLPDPLSTFHVYRQSSRYSMAWIVKGSENYQTGHDIGTQYGTAAYHEAVIYIGDLDGQTLKSLYGPENITKLRTDYTAEQVAELRKVCSAAKQAARDAESALSHFGEYDR